MKLIVIIIQIILSIINLTNSLTQHSFLCPGYTSEMSDICAMEAKDEESEIKLNLFDRCPKNRKCRHLGKIKSKYSGYYQCSLIIDKLKIGKSCDINDQCLTNKCENNKCKVLEIGETCVEYCGPGKFCSTEGICKELTQTINESCNSTISKECGYGMACGPDNKCIKFNSIENNKISNNNLLCKSGISYNGYCREIDKNPSCSIDSISNNYVAKLKFKGESEESTVICDSITIGSNAYYYSPVSKIKTLLWKNYIEKIEDLDFDEFIEDKDFNYNNKLFRYGFSKWKNYEAYLKYEYSNILLMHGIFDSDGEIMDDKGCEYKFYIRNVAKSNYINIFYSLYFYLLLFILL